MKNDLATLFYRKPLLLILTIAVLAAGGLSAINSLPRLEDPRLMNRNPIVLTFYPGASAKRVETTVTDKLEDALREVSEIKEIVSTSRPGVSTLALEMKDHVNNMDKAYARIREKLDDVESQLPVGSGKPDFDSTRGAAPFTLLVRLTHPEGLETNLEMTNRLAEDLADRLRNVFGTEIVRIYGGVDEQIEVQADPAKLAALQLDGADLARAVRAADAKVPAGYLRGDQDLLLEISGELESTARIADIPLITDPSGRLVRVSDVARVQRSVINPPNDIGISNGQRAVFVGARIDQGFRVDRWAEKAKAAVHDFGHAYAGAVDVSITFDQNRYTSQRLDGLVLNLLTGVAIIFLVVFFTMGPRAALLVGTALPLCAGGTLFGLQVMGIPIHQMSIFGMIIAGGLLIDNAIVMVDEVGKRISGGDDRLHAVRQSVHFLFVPLLGSTLTTVLSFMPIFLLPGSVGEFVGSIAVSVILALITSFMVALTVIPAMTGILWRTTPGEARASFLQEGLHLPRLSQAYERFTSAMFKRPLLGLALAVSLPILGFMSAPHLRNQFFPGSDRDQFHIEIWNNPAASIHDTRQKAAAVEALIREESHIQEVDWRIGGSFPAVYYNLVMDTDRDPAYAQGIVRVTSAEVVPDMIKRLQDKVNLQLPDSQIMVRMMGQGPPIESPIEIRIYGPDLTTLRTLGETVRAKLYQLPEVITTRAGIGAGSPRLALDVDEDEARLAGLRLTDIADQLGANLEGVQGGAVIEDSEEIPVRIKYPDTVRGNKNALASTRLKTPDGADWLPLSALGATRLEPEPNSITRRDGERCNLVRGYIQADALPIEVTNALMANLESDGFQLPPGYRLELGGDAAEQSEAVGGLFAYLPVLLLLMAGAVTLSFNSTLLAAILGMVAFLSVGLAMGATWLGGFPLGFNPLIGMAGLIGIALNDSIVVLAAIRENASASAGDPNEVARTVMGSCRHVLSTTFTTIGGFLPIFLAGGEFWPPLAMVIAGGVAGATLLALWFVPSAYILVQPYVNRVRKPKATPVVAKEAFA